MVKITEEGLRKRFQEVEVLIEDIEKQSVPLRTKRDKHVNAAREKENEMNAEIKKIERELFALKSEKGMIIRALKGNAVGDAFKVVKTAEADDKDEKIDGNA